MRRGTLLLGSRVRLRGGTLLRRRAFLLGCSYWLNWPLLGCWPFRLNRLVGGPGLWPLLHWGSNRLAPFHGQRSGGYDRLRLAAVYGNKLGAVRARCSPLLLLNG